MKKTIRLTESDLTGLVKTILKEHGESNYMFFSNLEQIKRQCELLLDLDPNMINELLDNGHDWADDHISEAKTNVDQVFDFFMNEKNGDDLHNDHNLNEAKKKENVPTNPALWKRSLAWAKSRYKVCPSAYCNGAAAKHYKSLGGRWRKK
jgi:hypothetical protein